VDDCWAESHVSAQAEHAGDFIGVGVHPGFGNLQELCNPHRFEEWIKAAEPLLDTLAAESEVRAEPLETGNFASVRAHPVGCHHKNLGKIPV